MLPLDHFDALLRTATLAPGERRRLLAEALSAADTVLRQDATDHEALSLKALLLRMQADVEQEPAVKAALLDEADAVRERAIRVQKAKLAGF